MSGVSVGKHFVKQIRACDINCGFQNNDKDTCGTCFFGGLDDFTGNEKNQLLWNLYLAYRGDYTCRNDKDALNNNISKIFLEREKREWEYERDKIDCNNKIKEGLKVHKILNKSLMNDLMVRQSVKNNELMIADIAEMKAKLVEAVENHKW